MTRPAIVLSKWSSRAALAVVQTAVGAALATFMFGIEWGSSLLAVAALLGAYVALCTSVALWLGSVARSEAQASAISVIAGNILAALGGCWWPAEVSPLWMQKISILLPTGMAMDGLHRLMSFGEPAASVLPHIAVLTVLALATGWLAARAFRFE
jgi:ABC-2 type transport system permease protein